MIRVCARVLVSVCVCMYMWILYAYVRLCGARFPECVHVSFYLSLFLISTFLSFLRSSV